MITVDRRLYLAADRKTLVEEGDPRAAFLWAGAGTEVTREEATRVGYTPDDKKAAASVARATANDERAPNIGQHSPDLIAPLTDTEIAAAEDEAAEIQEEADMEAKSAGKPADKSAGKPADKSVRKPAHKSR